MTKSSAVIREKSRSNVRTTRTSTPEAAISSAFRSTVVSSRGSLPGESTSRGCRSNVIATDRTPRSSARRTTVRRTA